jgi:hypothetical protein
MIICHRMGTESRHFQLLELTLEANICLERRFHKRQFVPFRMKQTHASAAK